MHTAANRDLAFMTYDAISYPGGQFSVLTSTAELFASLSCVIMKKDENKFQVRTLFDTCCVESSKSF